MKIFGESLRKGRMGVVGIGRVEVDGVDANKENCDVTEFTDVVLLQI